MYSVLYTQGSSSSGCKQHLDQGSLVFLLIQALTRIRSILMNNNIEVENRMIPNSDFNSNFQRTDNFFVSLIVQSLWLVNMAMIVNVNCGSGQFYQI